MSALVARAGDEQIAQLRAQAEEQRQRARWFGRQSDAEGAREALALAGELQRRIAELEHKPK